LQKVIATSIIAARCGTPTVALASALTMFCPLLSGASADGALAIDVIAGAHDYDQ
jgi:hypothetical protein